ncbi:MAG: rhodanese-like domain-containing protein, partial [Candidatus Omnitrophica bacterium]|nr:rhodanese-like domain-containing protein [Candidatus Omnitrophota bacterium]
QEHIPGSFSVPLEEGNFEKKMENLVETKSEPVVVYCANSQSEASPKAAAILEEAGFEAVYDYEGGLESWKNAKYQG